MCFSPTASFGSSVILFGIGAATIRQTTSPRQWLLAATPIFFAIQQFLEGLVWVLNGQAQTCAASGFLFFALGWWPIVLPFAIYLVEPDARRRRYLLGVNIAGVLIGSYLIFFLFLNSTRVEMRENSLWYALSVPWQVTANIIYRVVIVAGGLLSSFKAIRRFGVAMLATMAFALTAYWLTEISVWCFFVALLSGMLYFHFREQRTRLQRGARRS